MSVRDPRKIYISNIPHGCRERDLGRLFEELGRILLVDYKNKFAFIEYERSNAAADAIHKYDGIEFMGRRLRVEPYCYRLTIIHLIYLLFFHFHLIFIKKYREKNKTFVI